MKTNIQTIKFLLMFALVVVLHGMLADVAQACPTCKDSLHGGRALGFAISILFMLTMPFTIFSFWAVTIFRLCKKSNHCSASE